MDIWAPRLLKASLAILALVVLGSLFLGYASPLMTMAVDVLSYCF